MVTSSYRKLLHTFAPTSSLVSIIYRNHRSCSNFRTYLPHDFRPFHCRRNQYGVKLQSNTVRSFATSRQKRAAADKEKRETSEKHEDNPMLSPSNASSIIGKRPGQTPFSPLKTKVTSTSLTILPNNQNVNNVKNDSRSNNKILNNGTPIILPPSEAQFQSLNRSCEDNSEHAHTQSFITSMMPSAPELNNPVRKLFHEQGILPPPPHPIISKEKAVNAKNNEQTLIPEPDPSGVSRANAEDILDLASMYDPSIHLPDKPNFSSSANRNKYEPGTPMTDELIAYIGVRGPITVAEYMRRVLRDGRYGYYTTKGSRSGKGEEMIDWDFEDDDDKCSPASLNKVSASVTSSTGGEHIIGSTGDFITAPEVSQLFGESLLVWFMIQYEALRKPTKIQLVEIGPGKGTLICDILRCAILSFSDFASSLTASCEENVDVEQKGKLDVGVHLIEVTNGMRARQKESIQNLESEKSISEKRFHFQFVKDGVSNNDNLTPKENAQNIISLQWHDSLSTVPTNDVNGNPIPTFIICQELVDALPIHSFQKVEGGVWRERLVDVAIRDESEALDAAKDIRRAVTQRYANAESNVDQSPLPTSSSANSGTSAKLPRLRFVIPPDTTPALRTLLRVDGKGYPLKDNHAAQSLDSLPVGSIIEACPEGLILVQDIADLITKCKGAALIIDYGGDGTSGGDTLRGFWKHTQVHPLSRPGEVDVTADVDFGALREAVNQRVSLEDSIEKRMRSFDEKKIEEGREMKINSGHGTSKPETRQYEAFGPISQGQFLASMGIVDRVEKYIEDAETTDEQANELFSALERLVEADQMGERYKVMAIAPRIDGVFPPPGF